jgi:predicted ATPase
MINSLELKNFKSWEKASIDFFPITGLFGTNSSGKSSLLQFFLLLKQTKNNSDRSLTLDFGDTNSLTNLGSYKDTVFQHDENRNMEWSISWKLTEAITISDPEEKRTSVLFRGDYLSLKTNARIRLKRVVADYVKYCFSNQTFSLERKNKNVDVTEFVLNSDGDNKKFKFVRTPGRVWQLPGPIKTYSFPDQAKTYFQNSAFLSEFEVAYENLMDRIFYLGPLREYPRREYLWAGTKPLDVGKRGEKVVDSILAATAARETRNVKYKGKTLPFQKIIAYWLKEIGLIHSFKVDEVAEGSNLYRVKIKITEDSEEVLITDVGFGVSQFLPVLVLLYYAPENSIILLEQPEIHLHPAIQSGLADIIISASKRRNLQIIFESHSEHLLRRIQRRIATEEVESNDVKIYFCSQERGRSKINDINIDLFGEIHNWPKNFFGDEFSEITAIQKAKLKRKIKNEDNS